MTFFDEKGIGYLFEPKYTNDQRSSEAWQEFMKYHRENPQIWDEFIRRVELLIKDGYKRIGGDLIFRNMRWHGSIRGCGHWKIDNNHYPYYIREYLRLNPHRDGFFETRKLKRK